MFHFETCEKVPEKDGRGLDGGGGLVDVEGRVVWGREGVYWLDELEHRWKRWTDVVSGGTLGVCGNHLVCVGNRKDGISSKKVMVWKGREWTFMSDMLIGCSQSNVVSAGEDGLVVLGGRDDDLRRLSAVQILDGKTQTWQIGQPLPQPCYGISAVVHQGLIFMMGGVGMDRAVWCANVSDLTHDKQQSTYTWRELPDVPYLGSSVCMVDGVLLAIGGYDERYEDTSAIYAFSPIDQKWQHVGDMPFKCSYVDTLLLSGGRLLLVDGDCQRVLRITVEGLATLFPDVPNETNIDERRLYEEAMTKGYVETSVTKCLILGAAGVGKTHFKHLILKKDPPEQRVSTGLADNPVRAISFSLAGVSGQEDDWFVIKDDQALLSVVGGSIRDGVSMASSTLADVVGTLPKMTINVPSNEAGISLPDPIPADVSITKDTTKQSRAVVMEDELIHHIKDNHSSDRKKLCGVEWIQFIDSGGQLQYHDILPLFVQNTSVIIFVFNLSEELSHHPTIDYYGADGKPVAKPYRSSLSHKQILQHCLGAICSSDTHYLGNHQAVIIVGTHPDREDRCTESRDMKNQQLKALLDPTYFNVLYNGEELERIIFPLNCKSPQKEDRNIAQKLRKEILTMSPPQPIKMPIAWFALEVILQRSSNDGILSLAECQVFAKRLYIEGDAFSAALHHLVHHNMFLYYPKVLPQTVFCDPQVVLTKVTELVEYHHKLMDNPDMSVAATSDLIKFRDYGQLSVKVLKMFPKYYKEGVFTPQDLLALLVSLHVIALVSNDEYLMPALLPNLDCDKVSMFCQQFASLIVKPTKGCVPNGLFCCLVAHLLAPTNPSPWKVCKKRKKPSCLYRNCISFLQSDGAEIVTLVDMFSYIQVIVDEASYEVCRGIRDCVYSGIKNASGALNYHGLQFEDAFICKGANCTSDPPHVAVVVGSKLPRQPVYKWRCTLINDQRGNLNKDQLMWLMDSTVPTCTLTDVEKELTDVIKWRTLGENLCIPEVQLANMESDKSLKDMKACKRAMLQWWLENDPEVSWSKLAQALEGVNGNLATVIHSKYCGAMGTD